MLGVIYKYIFNINLFSEILKLEYKIVYFYVSTIIFLICIALQVKVNKYTTNAIQKLYWTGYKNRDINFICMFIYLLYL